MNRTHMSRMLFVFTGAAIVTLSFWFTLKLLDQSPPEPAPLPSGTPSTNLAELPPLGDARLFWVGIAGINAHAVAGAPAVSEIPVLRLVALDDGVHTLAARVNGLIKNERYRITAWVKPQTGANFGIAARDQPDRDNGPNNGRVVFDLASQSVLSTQGNVKHGIELVGQWLTVWIDLLSVDGQFVVNFYICNGDSELFKGDGKLSIILGGIAVQ
jgi:hypothetical protein